MAATVTLDRPENVSQLLAVQAGLTVVFIAMIVYFKPYATDEMGTDWTRADKAQLVQLASLLVQYVAAVVLVVVVDGDGTVPGGVDVTTTIVTIISILAPVVYMVLLSRGRDPFARWCVGPPRTTTKNDDGSDDDGAASVAELEPEPDLEQEPELEPDLCDELLVPKARQARVYQEP